MAALRSRTRPAALLLVALLALSCAPPSIALRAWVYTLVSADYGGELMLPHFINYYHQLGITYRRFLIIVHHTPGKYPRKGLELILGICQGYSVECRVWEGEFSSDTHMAHMLRMLDDFVYDPFDWVVSVDSDEFQEWPGMIRDVIEEASSQGSSFINSYLVDRVAPGGALPPISPAAATAPGQRLASLFAQFPLRCRVVRNLYNGWDFKVAAFRNYLRSGRANHRIVEADIARAYYGPCTPGRRCARGRNVNLDLDLFNLTPYHRYEDQYKYAGTPADAHGGAHFGLWRPREHLGFKVRTHHFKWHAGVVDNLRDRMELYRGDCRLGEKEKGCTPLLLHWKESARAYAALAATRRLNLTGMQCEGGGEGGGEMMQGEGWEAGDEDVGVDTTRSGLAWEQFEESLNVVSKVRNTIRGDSQTRQAAKLAAGKDGGDA